MDNIDCALTGIPPNMYEHLVRTGMYKHGPLSLDPRQLLPSIINLKGSVFKKHISAIWKEFITKNYI